MLGLARLLATRTPRLRRPIIFAALDAEEIGAFGSQAHAQMLRESIKYGEKREWKIGPLIGVSVPGTVLEDGGLEGGILNLPGDWKAPQFNLPARLRTMVPEICGEPTQVIMHNDAVVQGLSEAPFMTDVEKWAVLTIGTGLGNAVFRNKEFSRK